ncbi:conserved membrane hypothetical protein [Sphingomonas sp. EC-HK361]|uniref:DUF3667 domain-containing protein n=1 Tax=Sphingomonas sp. EC-HK361 TaxID=2038397 RepID=UPI001256AAFA|nr:DUF3667 domain-containing protein [Sphingomonas sp. EC-HK361]VVT08461.1 conserved membrane hypothetical protein [Sphingomonas sp. EC-HK361]
MSGGIETAADIATGGLFARAVEPRAGEASHGAQEHGLCLNCGTALIGEHCHACGQAAHVHRSLGAIGHELAHGIFHFEGKIWRTLPMLVLHPGALTRRYVAGERARFVSPLALFLFTVFLMFATISAVGGELLPDMTSQQQAQAKATLDTQLKSARTERARNAQKIATAERAGKPVGEMQRDQKALDATIVSLDTATRALTTTGRPMTITDLHTGWERLDHGIAKANANPALVIYKLQTSAYKYSWGLIPLSVPFVALLFLWRRRFHLYDHAIFVTYSLGFMMLLVITLILAGVVGAGAGIITMAALLVPPVHMFAQLRGAYSLRKRSALWRTIALTIFAFVALTTFLVLLLLHGLAE